MVARMDERVVLTERRGGILTITINRPRVRNAINLDVLRGLIEAREELDTTPDLAVGILTGAEGVFCAGMDLKAFVAGEEMWTGDYGMKRFVSTLGRKPLIAALEGFAVAGGLELALACDILVAARSTRLGIPESQRSLVAGGGALLRLPRRIGIGNAMKLALTGELISGVRASELGLIDELAEDGEALETAMALATAIAANGPLSVMASKAILWGQEQWPISEFWDRQSAFVDPVMASEDAKEGSRAFAEKRSPVWAGR
jgi:enoyl-CoA hydratase